MHNFRSSGHSVKWNDQIAIEVAEKVEAKAEKWFGRLKKGWTPTTQYSPKLARLRDEWETAVKKHKKKWKPKYNFGDLFA